MISLRTLVLFGAAGQIALFVALPYRVAMIPAALFGLNALITTAIQASNTSARCLSGRFFHFGVRFNHPLDLLSPGAKQTIDHFVTCNNLVEERADEYGILGLSPWRAAERGSNNTLMMVYYSRDFEGMNKFAHDDVQRKAWDYLAKSGLKHIGFFHEAFCVPPKAYESIYGSFPPFLMGAASVLCVGETGDDAWVRPTVSADLGALRSQFGRMGRAFKKTLDT
ncbi:hypothetical protein LTR62_002641 [Meristemomyces frigidus]|uniref:Monooxygenase n=1 Tax=Meristemomyces frigidus TaxID=1508187 RepID=A0AAN7YFS3_9PEZI|nr:hypothetical protein LTR62_002641 [Meristemomyces frigidus]